MFAETEVSEPKKELKSIKVWSERLGKYYYKSKDPKYYTEYFHKTKGPKTCDICGKVVTCQLYSHKKSRKCQMTKQASEIENIKRELEDLKQRL